MNEIKHIASRLEDLEKCTAVYGAAFRVTHDYVKYHNHTCPSCFKNIATANNELRHSGPVRAIKTYEGVVFTYVLCYGCEIADSRANKREKKWRFNRIFNKVSVTLKNQPKT